jgi:uncharacterized membrane protein required for colicin V production
VNWFENQPVSLIDIIFILFILRGLFLGINRDFIWGISQILVICAGISLTGYFNAILTLKLANNFVPFEGWPKAAFWFTSLIFTLIIWRLLWFILARFRSDEKSTFQRLTGFCFGLIRGWLLAGFLFFALSQIPKENFKKEIENSKLAEYSIKNAIFLACYGEKLNSILHRNWGGDE